LQIAPSGYQRHAARSYDPSRRSARAKRDWLASTPQEWMGTLADAPRELTRPFEICLQSQRRGAQSMRNRAGYNHSTSCNAPNYHNRHAMGEWIIRFRAPALGHDSAGTLSP